MYPTALNWPAACPEGCRMSANHDRNPVEILLVEDSPNDAELMVEALGESELAIRVTVIDDGQEAIEYLRRQRSCDTAGRPDLILLDLHLPRKSGQEILAEIKQDEGLRAIPVIIMTSFGSEQTIQNVYDLRANCCVLKPSNLEQFALAVKKIESFWMQQVRLRQKS